jgi:hypothetical protein
MSLNFESSIKLYRLDNVGVGGYVTGCEQFRLSRKQITVRHSLHRKDFVPTNAARRSP